MRLENSESQRYNFIISYSLSISTLWLLLLFDVIFPFHLFLSVKLASIIHIAAEIVVIFVFFFLNKPATFINTGNSLEINVYINTVTSIFTRIFLSESY